MSDSWLPLISDLHLNGPRPSNIFPQFLCQEGSFILLLQRKALVRRLYTTFVLKGLDNAQKQHK